MENAKKENIVGGFNIGDKHNVRPQILNERRFICALCQDFVDKVRFDEDRDNDFCDDCY